MCIAFAVFVDLTPHICQYGAKHRHKWNSLIITFCTRYFSNVETTSCIVDTRYMILVWVVEKINLWVITLDGYCYCFCYSYMIEIENFSFLIIYLSLAFSQFFFFSLFLSITLRVCLILVLYTCAFFSLCLLYDIRFLSRLIDIRKRAFILLTLPNASPPTIQTHTKNNPKLQFGPKMKTKYFFWLNE